MNQSMKDAQERINRDNAVRQAQSDARKQPLSAEEVASLTLGYVDSLSSDEYKIHVTTNPAFVTKVNELEAARGSRPRQR